MMEGGHPVFHGPSSEALEHFQKMGFDCPPNMNPADWLMDVIEGSKINMDLGRTMEISEIRDRWLHSPQTVSTQSRLTAYWGQVNAASSERCHRVPDVGRQGLAMQLHNQVKRDLILQLRGITEQAMDIILVALGGIVLGFLFAGKTGSTDIVFRDVLATLTVCMTAAQQALKCMAPYEAIYWKETAAGGSRSMYFVAKNIARIPMTLSAPLIFWALLYSAIFPYTNWLDGYSLYLALQWSAEGLGFFVAVAMGTESAQIGSIVIVLMSTMVAGGYPPLNTLTGLVRAISNVSMQRWALEGFFLLELHGMGYREDYVKPEATKLGYKWNNLEWDFCAILISGLAFRVLAWALLFVLDRDKTK